MPVIGASFDSIGTPLQELLAGVLGEAATGKRLAREPGRLAAGAVPESHGEGPREWDTEEPLEGAVL